MGASVDVAREGYAAFNAGDVDALLGLLAPDFEWHEAAEIPGPKSATGREDFVRFMRGFELLWEEFSFEPLEMTKRGDVIYARVRARGRGRASDEPVEFVIHHVWRLRGELFVRMDAYLEEAEARAAAGVEPSPDH